MRKRPYQALCVFAIERKGPIEKCNVVLKRPHFLIAKIWNMCRSCKTQIIIITGECYRVSVFFHHCLHALLLAVFVRIRCPRKSWDVGPHWVKSRFGGWMPSRTLTDCRSA